MGSKWGTSAQKSSITIARLNYFKVSAATLAPQRRVLLWSWSSVSNLDCVGSNIAVGGFKLKCPALRSCQSSFSINISKY
mmetsp:Transcript_49556/g.99722  ORF Transcript_49556/g.99722 Transcript_49556/m.99722 type:complete len:80 (-) Transcript_49556:82-321(-)